MNTKLFSEAMSEVNDKYYEEAANYHCKKHGWVKFTSGSLRTGKRCCVKSYPKRNAERAATALSSGARSLKALCRKQRT